MRNEAVCVRVAYLKKKRLCHFEMAQPLLRVELTDY